MSAFLAAAVVLIILAGGAELFARRARARRLRQIRARWGQPSERPRKLDAIAEYHNSIAGRGVASDYLDNRTWTDLNLDDVLAHIDRTESTLGQQALYHRFRCKHSVAALDEFEIVVDRLSTDANARECVQLALASLQDSAGYDLWWLAQPDALERPRWHFLFPLWAVVVLAALALTPIWPSALMVPVAGVAVNLIVRVRTAWRVNSLIAPFRQVGALIAAAERIRSAKVSAAVADSLDRELPALKRLNTIARWVGRDSAGTNDLIVAFRE